MPHSLYKYLFSEPFVRKLFECDTVSFKVDGDYFAIPADALECPVALASLASAHAPEIRQSADATESGLVFCWHHILSSEMTPLGLSVLKSQPIQQPKQLPPIIETALQVHVLGLESQNQMPVVAEAADQFLMNDLVQLAEKHRNQRGLEESSPVASFLVNVIAKTLRPWSFSARPLTTSERVVLLYLLADMATGKARKLLHEEKKHAHHHPMPEVLNNATNRALRRWHCNNLSFSPLQHVLRTAATLRYLNCVRRAEAPHSLDVAVVMDLVKQAS